MLANDPLLDDAQQDPEEAVNTLVLALASFAALAGSVATFISSVHLLVRFGPSTGALEPAGLWILLGPVITVSAGRAIYLALCYSARIVRRKLLIWTLIATILLLTGSLLTLGLAATGAFEAS